MIHLPTLNIRDLTLYERLHAWSSEHVFEEAQVDFYLNMVLGDSLWITAPRNSFSTSTMLAAAEETSARGDRVLWISENGAEADYVRRRRSFRAGKMLFGHVDSDLRGVRCDTVFMDLASFRLNSIQLESVTRVISMSNRFFVLSEQLYKMHMFTLDSSFDRSTHDSVISDSPWPAYHNRSRGLFFYHSVTRKKHNDHPFSSMVNYLRESIDTESLEKLSFDSRVSTEVKMALILEVERRRSDQDRVL